MKTPLLTFRLARRAIGAVALSDEHVTFVDGRHLRSTREAALRGGMRYVDRVLALTDPGRVALDCPHKDGGTTEKLVEAVRSACALRHVAVQIVPTSDLLRAFGVPAVHSRLELRQVVAPLWTELETMRAAVRPYVVDAAAAALYAETAGSLGAMPPE